MTDRRKLEFKYGKAQNKVMSISCAIGDLEDAIDKKRIELEKADKELERLNDLLEPIDTGIDDGSPK